MIAAEPSSSCRVQFDQTVPRGVARRVDIVVGPRVLEMCGAILHVAKPLEVGRMPASRE